MFQMLAPMCSCVRSVCGWYVRVYAPPATVMRLCQDNHMANNGSSNGSTVHSLRRVRIVVAVFTALFVLALISAFAWPGWAVRETPKAASVPTATASKATIEAKALPTNASDLLKAMPDHVSNFARTQADTTDVWSDSSPVEEYKIVYSNGTDKDAVTLTVGQWSDATKAQNQYNTLTGQLKGSSLAQGAVKVSGEVVGKYDVKANEDDDTKATAVWRNDTVVFSATGAKDSVVSIYQLFPL